MTKILGPVSCIACKKPVWWDRTGAELRLMEGKKRHECVDSPLAQTPRKMAA